MSKLPLILLVAFLAFAGAVLFTPARSYAAFNMFGRSLFQMYYSNAPPSNPRPWGDYIFASTPDLPYDGLGANWQTTTMTADIFISEVEKRLNSREITNQGRASAVINMMLGLNANDAQFDSPNPERWRNGYAVAQSNLATWEARVRQYDAAGRVNFNDVYTTAGGLDWLGAATPIDQPVKGLPDVQIVQLGAYSEPAIIFYAADGTQLLTILKKCSNLSGEVAPLPSLYEPTQLACGTLAVLPQQPELGDTIVVQPTARYSGGPPTPTVNVNSIQVRNAASQPGTIGSTASASGGIVQLTSASFTVPTAGLYTVSWTVTMNQGTGSDATVSCGGQFAPADSFTVLSYPFVRVKGGDTSAGISFAAPNAGGTVMPCSSAGHNPDAGVTAYNRNSAPTYTGAGGSYAVYAMGYIQSYASDQDSTRGAAALAFANVNYSGASANSLQTGSGRFGGLFGTAPCADYWGSKPADNQLTPLGANTPLNNLSGDYLYTGNLTINNALIQAGNKLTVYVKGNVNITGDIVYQNNSGAWRSTVDIPNFRLIVNGRIFIDPTTNQLDGVYVAVPNADYLTAASTFASPAAGTISTCSNGFASHNPALAATNNFSGVCNTSRPLVINGSFVANQIWLLRTYGTLNSNQPAEVFNYTPELWLAPSQGGFNAEYKTISGLPPIL